MISVIVPVYNVEKYLEECLDSIKNQTYSAIEVILVNDGSTDSSKEICEKYCKQDSRFLLTNQENQGLSAARNKGVEISTGEYIVFVDSDDIIKTNYLEKLMQYMAEDVDIVECIFTVKKMEFLDENIETTTIIFEGDSNKAVKFFPHHTLNVNAVTKLYRREIVEAVPYIEGVFYEDVYSGIGMLKYIR